MRRHWARRRPVSPARYSTLEKSAVLRSQRLLTAVSFTIALLAMLKFQFALSAT